MNHDERDEKLVHFLRSHRPDIPRESHDFEERLLNATVRRSLSSKLKGMLKINWATTGALCAAVSLTAIIFMRPQNVRQHTPVQSRWSLTHRFQNSAKRRFISLFRNRLNLSEHLSVARSTLNLKLFD